MKYAVWYESATSVDLFGTREEAQADLDKWQAKGIYPADARVIEWEE